MANFKELMNNKKCCVVIPTYNNEATLAQVIDGVLEYTSDLIIVNDGSTDTTPEILKSYESQATIVSLPENKGKGYGLQTAFKKALELGFDYVITIDSDGQHFASNIPDFVDAINPEEPKLLIGARNMEQENVPGKSSFGNKFSNFWYMFHTGIKLSDTQSGFRLYPVKAMESISYFTNRFEFEIEVLVKAAWKGIPVENIPIKVHYDPIGERISHFRPFQDFTRISFLNTYFFFLAVLYYIPKRFILSLTWKNIQEFVKKNFFNKDESPSKKALSLGFGLFMGIFPVWGYQMLIGVALAHLMKLNKAIFLVAANISIPPMIPFIIYGSYKMGAFVVTEPKDDLLFSNGITLELVKDNFVQYLLGAILLAVIAGVAGTVTTLTWLSIRKKFVSGTVS